MDTEEEPRRVSVSVEKMAGKEENWVDRLQSFADQRNLTVVYDTIISRDDFFEMYKCSARLFAEGSVKEDSLALGIGPQKRLAKLAAAKALLLGVLKESAADNAKLPSLEATKDEWESKLVAKFASLPTAENYVGRLQELCQRYNWPFPTYNFEELTQDQWVASGRFRCFCSAFAIFLDGATKVDVQATGTGETKKAAKAASAMGALDVVRLLVPLVEKT